MTETAKNLFLELLNALRNDVKVFRVQYYDDIHELKSRNCLIGLSPQRRNRPTTNFQQQYIIVAKRIFTAIFNINGGDDIVVQRICYWHDDFGLRGTK